MSDKEEKKTIGTPNSDEEEQLHFEIPKEMHDALSQLVKYQNTCFRECTTLLAGFKATKRAPMTDIVKLRYDKFYYNHKQKAMRFIRQKTMRNLP